MTLLLEGGTVLSCTTGNWPASLYDGSELTVFFFAFKVGRKARYMLRIVSHSSEDNMTEGEKTVLIGHNFWNIFHNDKNKVFLSALIL